MKPRSHHRSRPKKIEPTKIEKRLEPIHVYARDTLQSASFYVSVAIAVALGLCVAFYGFGLETNAWLTYLICCAFVPQVVWTLTKIIEWFVPL